MINPTQYDCAATYLNTIYNLQQPLQDTKKTRKLEDVRPTHTGKNFNDNAANKANHEHIDICI